MIKPLGGGEDITLEEAVEWFDVAPVIKRFGQWAVTEYGIECLVTLYPIAARRLIEPDWEERLSEKWWVDLADFRAAQTFARQYHVDVARPPESHLPDVPLPTKFVPHSLDYQIAQHLKVALMSMRTTHPLIKSWIPDAPSIIKAGLTPFEVKNIGMLGSAWSAFAHTLDALLIGIKQYELIGNRDVYTKLIECSNSQFDNWIEGLIDFAYPYPSPDSRKEPNDTPAEDNPMEAQS